MATVQTLFKCFMMMKFDDWDEECQICKRGSLYIHIYTFYIQNIPFKNVHLIMQNCVLCPASLMLYNVAMSMIL